MDEDDILVVAGAILLVFMVSFVVFSDSANYSHFETSVYPVQKAEGFLSLANTSNNITDIAGYIQDAYEEIQPFTGNPDWWFPTYLTSWSYIKSDMLGVEHQALEFDKTTNISGLSYLQDVNALHNSVNAINGLLYNELYWIDATPFYLVINILNVLVFFFSEVMAILYYDKGYTVISGAYIVFFVAVLINGIIILTL